MSRHKQTERRFLNRRHWHRRAIALIELAAIMVANAALVTLAVVTLASLHRTDESLRHHADEQQQIADLGRRLRSDLHAARAMAWDGKAQLLKLSMVDGAAVEYQASERRWERRQPGGNGAEGNAASPLSLRTPGRLSCRVSPEEASAGTLVELMFTAPPRAGAKNDRGLFHRLVVQVGRDAQLLQP
jgi:hypothetical protein